MEHFERSENVLVLIIPNAGIHDLSKFRKSLLSILSKIKIETIDPEFKDSLKSVYELLTHLQTDQYFKGSSTQNSIDNRAVIPQNEQTIS